MKIIPFIKKHLFDLFFVILLLFFFFSGKFNILFDRIKSDFGEGKGIEVKDFTIKNISSDSTIHFNDLKGKIVLINFWATWCPTCRLEIPAFSKLYEEYNPKGLEIIGVSVDQKSQNEILSFLKENNIKYPIMLYNKELNQNFGELTAVPTSFLINKSGKIYKKYIGYHLKYSFEKDIKNLLNLN